jgi:hypothetical protein
VPPWLDIMIARGCSLKTTDAVRFRYMNAKKSAQRFALG